MVERRLLLHVCGALLGLVLLGAAGSLGPDKAPAVQASAATPITVSLGPHLFVDDYWIQDATGVERLVNHPARQAKPVLDAATFGVSQPFVGVVPDPKGWRMYFISTPDEPDAEWFGPNLAVVRSSDGKTWLPKTIQRMPLNDLTYGTDVLDSGVPGPDRYKLAYTAVPRFPSQGDDQIKVRVAFASDGLKWSRDESIDALFPGHAQEVYSNWGDIPGSGYDPIRRQYWFTFRVLGPYEWTNAEGVTQRANVRRTAISYSTDFRNWSQPEVIFAPDGQDHGITQFYGGPTGVQARGDLLVGFLKVLRDDVTVAGAPSGAYGMGYTVLTWSRDGKTWSRDREPFFEPSPKVGAWDHAHAWIDESVPVGDMLYLYYGGYKWGHKYNPGSERQIGLAYLRGDRYVARYADSGEMRTPLLHWPKNTTLAVNADVKGWLDVGMEDASGKPVVTCDRLPSGAGDDIGRVVLRCPGVEQVQNPVRLVFRLDHTYLFGFYAEKVDPALPTPTAAVTPTPTSTPSPTSTPTPTGTPTPTATATSSFTPTATAAMEETVTPTPVSLNHGVFLPLFLRS